MATAYTRARRTTFFIDPATGSHTTEKHRDSIEKYTIDWSRMLGSATITSSTWTPGGGVTVSSPTSTTTTTGTTVSGTSGQAKNTVTTSSGETLIQRLVFRPQPYDCDGDYV